MNLVVVGLGYVGLPLAVTAAKSGYKVQGYDINNQKISELKAGKSLLSEINSEELLRLQSERSLMFTSELVKQNEKTIYIIAVPTPLNENKSPDLSMLKQACEEIAKVVVDGCLIINESTSYIGTLRNLIKPIIDHGSQVTTLKYAVAPERIDPGNKKWFIKNTPRLVSGISDQAKKEAVTFYRKLNE